jgi:outer membrane protein, adhesin transport system
MPRHRRTFPWIEADRLGPALAALTLLSACMGRGIATDQQKSFADVEQKAQAGQTAPAQGAKANSSLIADLQARRSVLPAKGPYASVANAVVAASTGAAAAELRVAQLKAEARSKNWLPSIGPSVNLTSLGGLATSLMLDQPLFDNGGRKAQREFASADVEVAAVTLSTALNQRVYEGLTDYVNAERARAQAAVSEQAASKLAGFNETMRLRVEGGISDLSEQSIINQRIAEMQATVAGDRQAEAAAMAELSALTGQPLSDLRGIDNIAASNAEPLSVVKARGEGARAIAQSNVQLAGMKLGISASTGLGGDGAAPGVRLTGTGLLNPGNKSDMAALRQTADLVDRQTAEAAETANRRIVALQQQKATLLSRQAQGAEVLRQTAGNLDLFTTQYKVGRRTLLELVSQYDGYARLQRDQASLRFDIALIDLEIARDRGVLVDGAQL